MLQFIVKIEKSYTMIIKLRILTSDLSILESVYNNHVICLTTWIIYITPLIHAYTTLYSMDDVIFLDRIERRDDFHVWEVILSKVKRYHRAIKGTCSLDMYTWHVYIHSTLPIVLSKVWTIKRCVLSSAMYAVKAICEFVRALLGVERDVLIPSQVFSKVSNTYWVIDHAFFHTLK
jgi:hypothetical protein